MDDEFFRSNYNTPFDGMAQFIQYQNWNPKDRNKHDELNDYDMQGAFKKYGEKVFDSENGHGTDEFKKPNHPTFSDESIYHGHDAPWGGKHEGGKWVKNEDGEYIGYTPSKQMVERTHDIKQMQRYFDKYEPDLKLILPENTD